MYPRLSDLINDWFGTHIVLPIMSYGFFVAIAFLVGAWFLYAELRRKGREGVLQPTVKKITRGKPATVSELLINFVLATLVGYKVAGFFMDYSTFAANPQEFLFSNTGSFGWGVFIGIVYTAWIWYDKDRKKLNPPKTKEIVIPPENQTWPIVIVAAVFGLIGSKIFDQLENWDRFINDPWGSLFSFSGLTFYGGLIVAGIAIIWYAHKHKIPWEHLGDSMAPSLILAYGIGRIGCHVAGDGDWGIVNTLQKPGWLSWLPDKLWSYNYPHNIINEGIPIPGCTGEHCMQLAQGVFPTPIYETVMALLIFAFLWSIRKKIKIPGTLFAIYLILNGIERFLIELIRVNNTYVIFGMKITQAEIISVAVIITGAGLWLFLYKRAKVGTVRST